MSHKKTAARFLAMAFALTLLVISASTSFGFFYNHFYLIPPSLLGETVGQLISGVVGVLLFDAATSIWLIIYLQDARTPEQRAISLLLAGFTFLGAAAASVAHLALSATGAMALDVATLDTISMIALVCVILGVIANFGGSLMYSRFSYDNKIAVRESDRSDSIQAAEDEQARLLDGLIAQGVKEQITNLAPMLAKEQASRLVESFRAREMAKYAGTAPTAGTAVPTTPAQQPARQNGSFFHYDQDGSGTDGKGRIWFDSEAAARASAREWSLLWPKSVEVFRQDGKKIADYSGFAGGVDTLGMAANPTQQNGVQGD